MSPNNINNPSAITFIFTLDTSVAATDYLRIVLPFKLNPITSAVWAPWSLDATTCTSTGTSNLAVVTDSTLASQEYFVQFYTDNTQTTLSGLIAGTAYYVTITGTIHASSQTGINLPVGLYTVSDILAATYIIYDSNPTFGTISLASDITTIPTMTVSTTIPSTETASSPVLGATYKVNVDITPKTTLKDRARIDIALTNTAFELLSCTSIASASDKITALTASYASLNTYTIRATVSSTLTAGNSAKYRFQCQIKNPLSPGTTKVNVQNRYGYIETISETGISSVNLQAANTASSGSSSAWSETNHQVQLGWGYPASSATALNIFSLYKDASAAEKWYQSTKTIFQPLASMTSTAQLQVRVSTVVDAGFQILVASIYHNLPSFDGQDITFDTTTQGILICNNVGQLQAQSYFISFKFNLLNTATATSVTDFGKVEVRTQSGGTILLPLSQTTLTNKAIATNVALFTGTNGIIASSTTSSGATSTTYVTNGEDIKLKLTFNYFMESVVTTSTLSTAVIDRGIEFYTSQALATPSTTVGCTIDTLSSSTDVLISDCAVSSQTSFTRLRFRLAQLKQTGAPVSTLFAASAQSGTIIFDKVQFSSTQFSSLNYVNIDTYDYYARWVQDFTALNPTIVTASGTSPFFFNSLVYKNGGLANVNVGTTFFATGASTSNDGTNFPTLIRITGYLTSGEQVGADRLLLFFNDLVPLNTEDPCFGPAGISCKYNENKIDNTATDSLTDYSGSRRIEITTDLTQRFNIYIPVSTVAGKSTLGFFIASAKAVSADASAQGIFSSMHSKRIAAVTSSQASWTVNPVGGTPALGVSGTPAMGSVSSPNINVPGGYVVPTANSGTSIGGAYGYCANYDFTIASGFQLQPYYTTTSTPEELCVALSYPSTSDTITCSVCPVHSTMSTGTVTTTSFTLPTMAGVDLYKLVYVVGSDNGDFLNAADDNQANVLSPLTLASTAISFSPLALNKDGKNVYAELKFTVVSALPKKIRINITPSSGTLKMTPIDTAATSVSCEPTTVSYTSCSASGTDTDIQLDVVANEEWGVAEHTIRFMVDSSGITVDEDVNYGMTIMVDGVTALGVGVPGAIHHQTTSSFTYKVMGATTDFIVLSDISYLFGTQGARTIVKFGFELPETVFLYPSQKLKFNLGGIASANTGEEPGCVVRDAVTLEAVGDFSHCDTTSLTALTLTAKSGAKGAYILELSFVIVPNPGSVTGITCELIGVDGTTPVIASDSATPLALPTVSPWTIIPAANVQYSRLYADAGSVSEIKLTIKPTVLPIDVQSSVYVYFPKYYAGKLGYQNVWCTAGGLPLACTLLEQRVLQLTSFPVTAAVGAAVEIKIYGVITPVVPNIPGKIFIAIDKGDYFSLTEQIEISDTASNAATPSALTIDKFSVSTNLIREQADYTIVFTTDSSGIRAQKIVLIDFPDRYGNILRGQTGPKISIRKTGDSVVTTVQSSSFGSRFKIVLPLNLDPSTSYTFVIKAIDNPENPMCIMDRPTISVATDATETSVSKRSASNIFNAAPISYYSDPNLKDLYWTDASGNVITSLTLSIGIFSAPIRIVPPTGTNFMNDITFSLSDNSISLLPETLTANRGSPYLSLRVAAPSSTYPGVTLLSFTKDESTTSNVYMQVAKLQLTLTNNNKTLPTPTLRIVKGGTSLPYKWEMDTLNMIPNSELKIQAAVTDPTNSALSIQGPSVLTFGPETPQLGFTFVLAASASAGSAPTFTLTLDGEDAANYIFPVYPTLITVDVLNPVATAPILTLTAPSVYTPTQQKLELTLDQMASVYWHVAYENQLTSTTCERVRAIYNEGATYDASSSTQAQYGVFYVYLENIASPQIISNLLSKTAYSYILCPVNQLDNMGTATTGTFTTADNTARLDKVTISFSKPITRNQLTILVCLFNTELQLPDRNVVAMDGTSCSQASVFDDFSSFDYQNVVIWINGDRASDITSTTSTVLNQYITSVQDSTPSDFLTTFNSALRSASLTSLYKSITLAVGPTYSLPSASTSSLTVKANSTSIVVDGLRLSSAGVVYAIATTDLNNIPTSAQIQASLDYSGTTVPSANALYSTSSVSLTLTDLVPSTTYNIYYVGSTADRTQYARVTTVNYVQKATTKAQTVSAGRLEISLVLTSILALLAFLL